MCFLLWLEEFKKKFLLKAEVVSKAYEFKNVVEKGVCSVEGYKHLGGRFCESNVKFLSLYGYILY